MNREEIEKRFDEKNFTETGGLYEDRFEYTDMGAIKSFFLDEILPEVLREIIPSLVDQTDSFDRGYNSAVHGMYDNIEKYNITL